MTICPVCPAPYPRHSHDNGATWYEDTYDTSMQFEMRVVEKTKRGEREVIFPCKRTGRDFVTEMPRDIRVAAVSVWWKKDPFTLEFIGEWNQYEIFVTKKGTLTVAINPPVKFAWEQ